MKPDHYYFQSEQLQRLLNSLLNNGYSCIGPQVRDGAIIFDEIRSIEQLPYGITDDQAPGSYTLTNNASSKFFDWANGPQAIKPLLFTAQETLWESKQSADGALSFSTVEPDNMPTAIIGARACDIAAMKLQDKHFLQQQFTDTYYKARREKLLIIAVNCARPADTCFCHSTGDGPFVEDSFDIALTELNDGFLCTAQTGEGEKLLQQLELLPCTRQQLEESASIKASASIQRKQLPQYDISSSLFQELTNDSWNDIASECLSCGNCTAVCPTCFCHSEKDVPALDGKSSHHLREWDSCFSQGHSYIHGVTIRSETSQRYRQWLSHKFSSWHEQYGRSGCVGCGRCIAWCPVGIDVTESLARFSGDSR